MSGLDAGGKIQPVGYAYMQNCPLVIAVNRRVG